MLAGYLKLNNASSVRELSNLSAVSTMTIRRDLEELHRRDIVRFMHGGAIYNPEYDEKENRPDYLLQKQKMLHRDEKLLIAKKAAALLSPQETFMLDSGTTLFYLAQELPADLPLTAICWSLDVIGELIKKPLCTLISLGGVYHPETQMFESVQGMELIKTTRASKVFISAGGVHPQLGVTSPFHYETETKRVAVKCCMSKILLVDSTKFGRVCASHYGEISDFDAVITDPGIPEEYRRFIQDAGVELVIA